jgi:signal transduction histidine kinase
MGLEVIHEFLDARRYAGPEYESRLSSLMQHKYASRQFDAIITTGNYAYRFFAEHRQAWFGTTPWVFCGVNDRSYERRGDDSVGSTGLTQKLDILSTIEIALRLHPERNLVYAIIDNNRNKQDILRIMQNEMQKLEKRPEIKVLDSPSLTEFTDLLKVMPSNALMLFLPFARDREGDYFSFEEVRALLKQHGRVPAYTLWKETVGDGIIGGKVGDAESHGREAAEMTLRIIRGVRPEDIPVVRGQSNRYMFNYNELKRFGVPLSVLPEGSIVLNRPPSFYAVNKMVIWLTLGVTGLLFLTVLFLTYNLSRRKKAEQALNEMNARLAEEYEQRKQLSSHLIDLLEQDRRDVAKELHDDVGQTLTTMKLDLAAFKSGSTPDGDEWKRFYAAMEGKLGVVMKAIRNTVQGLRPVALELQGLKNALQFLVNEMGNKQDLKTHFYCSEIPDRMDGHKELALFRISQEALNNSIKHAGARNVYINLIMRDQSLSLSVEDDGCGFDYDKVTRTTGINTGRSLGLVLMRERALQAGGELQINSRPGEGTQILVEMPIQ